MKTIFKNIFSVTNEDTRKVITIFGIKLKFKSNELIKRKNFIILEKNLKTLHEGFDNINNKYIEQTQQLKDLKNNLLNNEKILDQNKTEIAKLKKELSNIKIWQQNFYKNIPNIFPIQLSNLEKTVICKYLKNSGNYLEFGSGGSTFLALIHSNTNIISVESDINWLNYIHSYQIISNAEKTHRLRFIHKYIGEIKAWGYPINDELKENYPNYHTDIFKEINTDIIDIALIDGRFRVACTIQTIINCNNIKYILIHDYENREYYHILENYLDKVEIADTLAVFKVKEKINQKDLEHLYLEYKYIKK